jgi:hydroxymethylglutaryl-CoA lyase
MAGYPQQVHIVEVGPRDGLQNEPGEIDVSTKIEFINRLSRTGLRSIEVTSFVSPGSVPQLADAERVWQGIERRQGVEYPVLVPNMKGLERALEVGVGQVAVFGSVSETFSRHNIHCSITESLQHYWQVISLARERGLRVRAYISCVLGCPYEGAMDPGRVAELARHFVDAGCYEVSLGDTIGCGTPLQAREMLQTVAQRVPLQQLALHFHDTRGQALANILACLETGVAVIDASVAGLGGCPHAPGASGNLATEDLVYMLHGMGIETGVDLEKLIATGNFISAALSRESGSGVGRAGRC